MNNVLQFPTDRFFTVRECPRFWVVELAFHVGGKVRRQRWGSNFRQRESAEKYACRLGKRWGCKVLFGEVA
ncbi:hypothetical protein [Altererythrobacter lutimaris]|uniref:WGR domain-containing protein n=1 Tax=Altererythrobacter lutimaris TaxID=2743979 RepID=A0A850H818_9SPHN|nr:hypothetical protein [Altererythrobacter lutimaris]NVE93385.1 hypothetical protein [Altererythrobacter lutimaris]